MNILKTSIVIALVAVSCSGCAILNDARNSLKSDPLIAGGPVIADDTFMLKTQDESLLPEVCQMRFVAVHRELLTSTREVENKSDGALDFADALNVPTGTDAQRVQADAINKCTEAMMLLIDVRWGHFADELNATVANGTAAVDVATLGLNIAGGLTPAGTTKVLGAIAAGLTGSKSIINEDVLYKNSIQTILLQMEKDRFDRKQIILARFKKTSEPYHNMFEAALDLYAYDRAGTWNAALMSLQADTAANAARCEAAVRRQQMALGDKNSGNPGDIKDAGQRGTDPCYTQ